MTHNSPIHKKSKINLEKEKEKIKVESRNRTIAIDRRQFQTPYAPTKQQQRRQHQQQRKRNHRLTKYTYAIISVKSFEIGQAAAHEHIRLFSNHRR